MKFPFGRRQRPAPALAYRADDRGNSLLLGGLILCSVLPYLNTLFNDFVYDDSVQVLQNPYIQSLHYLRQIFTTTAWSFTGQGPSNYFRPMMSLGYLVCYQLFGPSAWAFHVMNVALHAAVVAGMFVLSWQLFHSRSLAFWASALFALHPIHSESVAWIGGVTDLELTLFYVLTVLLYVKMARPGGGADRRTLYLMVASFFLAALSKEQSLTLPLLATIYEHFFRPDRKETSLAQKLSRYDALWIAAAAYLVVRIKLLGAFAPLSQFSDLTRGQTVLSAIALLGEYFWKLLFPFRLNAFYVFHKSMSLGDWRVLAGIAAAIIYVALAAALWRRAREMVFAQVWLLLTLLPVLNANWVGENVFAERYLYLPSVGFCWLAAWGGLRLWNEAKGKTTAWRTAYGVGLAMVAILCMLRIVTRNRDWRDNFTLYSRTLEASPDAYLIRIDLGAVYERLGDTASAEREWQRALQVRPRNAVALSNLGMLYSRQKLYSLATEYLERAVQADPHYADAHIKLGFTYVEVGEMRRAEAQFRAAMAQAPLNVAAYAGLGYVYWKTGRDAEAEEILRRAEEINPADARVHAALGNFYAGKGRLAEAQREYETALRLDAANAEAQAGLRAMDAQYQAEPKR